MWYFKKCFSLLSTLQKWVSVTTKVLKATLTLNLNKAIRLFKYYPTFFDAL